MYFILICCHARLKYPLAIVNRALDTLGDQLLVGYNIGCTFGESIKTSLLASKFSSSKSQFCVAAYHGYVHNFTCQTQNHPNNIKDACLEDFEMMERLFSSSNGVAPLIQNATPFGRHLYIVLHLKQSDANKYLALGDMLLGNIKQAFDIVEKNVGLLYNIMAVEEITTGDLDRWQSEQAAYFASTLGKEADMDLVRVAYVELLVEYTDAL